MFRKLNILIVLVTFVSSLLAPLAPAHAQALLGLPEPGTMVSISPAYKPAIIKGLLIHKDNPFVFDFLVDPGQDNLTKDALKKESTELIKYFLAGLTIPDKDLWVNLSPYEKDRIIPEALSQTAMGRDLLAEDYILKQITASLIYPDKGLGKEFWQKVYAKAREMYGTTQIPVNTFNKVWITADRAKVYEHNNMAFVVDCHLKVMLEEDYMALKKHINVPQNESNAIGAAIVREVVLPELEKEVNTGKNFSKVRQIFNSIILASWYKENLKQALLTQVYADKDKVRGIDLRDKTIKEKIYRRYLEAYKKGVFNFIKEDVGPQGTTIPRKYFSGGMDFMATHTQVTQNRADFDAAMANTTASIQEVTANLVTQSSVDDGIIFYDQGIPKDEKEYFRGMVYRVLPNGIVRVSDIWDPMLDATRLQYEVERIINNPDMEAAFVKESILRQAEHGDQEVLLDSSSGVVSKYFIGKEVTVARSATEILKNPVSDDLTKVNNLVDGVPRPGGYFRIILHDYGAVPRYALAFGGLDADKVWELLKKQCYIFSNGMYQKKFANTPNYKEMVLPGLTDEQKKQVFDIMQRFRIDNGEDLYLLTNNYERKQQKGEDKLSAPGGAGRWCTFRDENGNIVSGKIFYQMAGLGDMEQIKVSPLDVDDPYAIRNRIRGPNCFQKFLDMYKKGIGRERFFPIREFYQELVGPKAISIARARTIASVNPLLDPDSKVGIWEKVGSDRVLLKYHWEKKLPRAGVTTEQKVKAIAGADFERVWAVLQLAQFLSETGLLPPYPDYYAQEFNEHMTPEAFVAALEAKGVIVPLAGDPLERLNMLIENKDLYRSMKRYPHEDDAAENITKLREGRPMALFDIKKFNRVLLTLNFPENSPQKHGYFPFNGWPYRKLGRQKNPMTMAEIRRMLNPSTSVKNGATVNRRSTRPIPRQDRRPGADRAAIATVGTNGGIDLSTQGIKWDITQDGQGLDMRVSPAMIARIRRDGLQSLTPVISRIISVEDVWPLAGLQAPAK